MRTIRSSVFETNSSSTHSMTIMSKRDYERWKSEPDSYYDSTTREIISGDQRRELAIKDIIEHRKRYDHEHLYDRITDTELNEYIDENRYDYPISYEEFYDSESCLETDVNEYRTESNDEIVILCKYGQDY